MVLHKTVEAGSLVAVADVCQLLVVLVTKQKVELAAAAVDLVMMGNQEIQHFMAMTAHQTPEVAVVLYETDTTVVQIILALVMVVQG